MVTVRKPAPDDAEAVAELLNALAQSLEGDAVVTRDEIAHWLRLPDVEFWVAEDADGSLAAYADLAERAARTRYWLDLREHPARRDLGGGRALLAAAEEHARARAVEGAILRGTFAAADEPLRALYEQSGFRFVRHALEMHIELETAPTEPDWPQGIAVRTFVPGDDDRRVHESHIAAFEDHWEHAPQPFAEWREEHLARPGHDPTLWFIAEDDGQVAGLCLCRVHPSGDPQIGYVEVLAVPRPWRRRGLGLALLLHAFAEFRLRGMTRAALDVDAENLTGAVRVYERAGMHVAKRNDTYEKAL